MHKLKVIAIGLAISWVTVGVLADFVIGEDGVLAAAPISFEEPAVTSDEPEIGNFESALSIDTELTEGIRFGELKPLTLPATVEDLNASGFYEYEGVYSHDNLEISEILWKDGKAQVLTFYDPFVMSVLQAPGMSEDATVSEVAKANNCHNFFGTTLFHYNGYTYILSFEHGKFADLMISADD